MRLPVCTYRIQLHHQFTFNELKEILDYLEQLGVSTVYASPIFTSVAGSLHGYDVADPHRINLQIGSEEDLMEMANALKKRNMSWLQDIVPNHMAFDSSNDRLMDVLERGRKSEYADYFDIIWSHPDFNGRLMIPFLGDELQNCIENSQITLHFDEAGFSIRYDDHRWPVSVNAYELLLPKIQDSLAQLGYETGQKLQQALSELQDIANSGVSKKEWQAAKESWLVKALGNESIKTAIAANVSFINKEPGLLKEILDRQYYEPAYWRHTEKRINYRRFFTVNGLICLRMQEKKVFEEYHQYIYSLLQKNYIQGLRIDHIDGLYDPTEYLKRLRELVGEDCYIIAEKILAPTEELPHDWQLEGTSGYEFLSHVSRLLTDSGGAKKLEDYYKNTIAGNKVYDDIVFENKFFVLVSYMRGELDNLTRYLQELGLWKEDKTGENDLKEALAAFMAAFPIYRIYPDAFPLDQLELADQALQKALDKKPGRRKELEWIRSLFEAKNKSLDEISSELTFLKRLMQFTGPLAAKGVEDTTFYFYNPLISHNEVGDEPGKLAISSNAFHRQMINRNKKTPFSLNTTSTHDTKRGEDARMRINVLSEVADEWTNCAEHWMKINAAHKSKINNKLVPSLNEEYFIYQSLIGGFPANLHLQEEDVNRLKEYVRKFLREEKIYTDWTEPDEKYEEACFAFIDKILDNNNGFLKSFLPFVEKVISFGTVYSLAQAMIKITAPGIPDIYQGGELWDLSYVDPDNRRPVDYKMRVDLFNRMRGKEGDSKELLQFLWQHREVGAQKMFTIYKSLQYRKQNPDVFLYGDYLPVDVEGTGNHAMAFARRWKDNWVIVTVPVGIAKKIGSDKKICKESFEDSRLLLPNSAPAEWINEFSKTTVSSKGGLKLADIFADFPVALLRPA
jgi:(1->4)-alpha-D-glucan 1-alpha-D-glucosylmutase